MTGLRKIVIRTLALSFFLSIFLLNSVIAADAPLKEGKVDLGALEATPVFQFLTDTATHKVGNRIAIFAYSNYGFGPQNELAPEFYLDGVIYPEIKGSDSMWVLSFAPFSSTGFHVAGVKVYIRDASQSNQLRSGIATTDAELAAIAAQLATETDPAVIAQLQQQQSEKQAHRAYLVNSLAEIRTLVKTETYLFYVYPAASPESLSKN